MDEVLGMFFLMWTYGSQGGSLAKGIHCWPTLCTQSENGAIQAQYRPPTQPGGYTMKIAQSSLRCNECTVFLLVFSSSLGGFFTNWYTRFPPQFPTGFRRFFPQKPWPQTPTPKRSSELASKREGNCNIMNLIITWSVTWPFTWWTNPIGTVWYRNLTYSEHPLIRNIQNFKNYFDNHQLHIMILWTYILI